MIALPGGRYVCKHCGHIVASSGTSFVCGCKECMKLRAANGNAVSIDSRSRWKAEARAGLAKTRSGDWS